MQWFALASLAVVAACGDSHGPAGDVDGAVASEWVSLPDVPGGAVQEIGVAALGDKIYVVGGFDENLLLTAAVRVYDTALGEWSSAAPLPRPVHHANVTVASDKLYVVGAMVLDSFNFVAIPDVWEYDPAADQWTAREPMPAGTQRGAAAIGTLGGQIYVAGGLRSGAVQDFSRYDPTTNVWQTLPNLPGARDHLVGAAFGDAFYVISGRGGAISALDGRVDFFVPAEGTWTSAAPIPTPRGGMAGAVVGGKIYVLGGEGNTAAASGVFPQVEAYDPGADTWQALPPMRTPRHGMGVAVAGDTLFVPGGATTQGFGAVATFESFTPP